jgi:hypothetical protein
MGEQFCNEGTNRVDGDMSRCAIELQGKSRNRAFPACNAHADQLVYMALATKEEFAADQRHKVRRGVCATAQFTLVVGLTLPTRWLDDVPV